MGGLLRVLSILMDWLVVMCYIVLCTGYILRVERGLLKGLNIYTRTAANSVVNSVGGQCGINSFLE